MDASKGNFGRCLIWFGEPTRQELDSLAAAGWTSHVSAIGQLDHVGIRSSGTVVALVDLRNAAIGCMRSLERLRDTHPLLPWLILTSVDTAMRLPQIDRFLQASTTVLKSPFDTRQLLAALSRIVKTLPQQAEKPEFVLIGDSPAMSAVRSDIRKYAVVDLPVLITGETGTGKEVAALTLHQVSARREHPFEALNCGALPPTLVQSELFGHERGAFTGANARRIGHFELAAGGTLFLDEVAELPPDAQTALLRLLQEGTLERVGSSRSIKLDVRVLAATHVDLEQAVAQGRFRDDLYYRLNVLRLHMPALRERGSDLEPLAQHFLDAFRARNNTRACMLDASALKALQQYAWPGNVRELRNRIQRAAVVAESERISAADLGFPTLSPSNGQRATLSATRQAIERDALMSSLRECGYNVSECARRLDVSRVTIYRLCKKHMVATKSLR